MCIIAAKPVGVAMPSDNIIENMWNGNSDGAGFMYAEKGSVHIRKGFMTFEDFRKALDEFCSTHDTTNTALVMHFRITTHGGTKPENCHPFPISESIGMLSKLDCKTQIGVAHNGVIDISPRKGISDTMEYIASQLAPLYRGVPDFYRNKHLIEMIYNATTSRLAFLDSAGEIFTVGSFVEDKGIKYSNESYKYTHRFFPCSYAGYGGWDDEYSDYLDPYDGDYWQTNLMWLDDYSGYIVTSDGDFLGTDEHMFALDKDNNVYIYSYLLDAMKLMKGATAYSNSGTAIRYNSKDSSITRELVFTPDTFAVKKNPNVKFTSLPGKTETKDKSKK